jgi:hypothetical protein
VFEPYALTRTAFAVSTSPLRERVAPMPLPRGEAESRRRREPGQGALFPARPYSLTRTAPPRRLDLSPRERWARA